MKKNISPSFTITCKLIFQINAGNYLPNRFAFGNDYAQVLLVVGVTFIGISRAAAIVGLAFALATSVGWSLLVLLARRRGIAV